MVAIPIILWFSETLDPGPKIEEVDWPALNIFATISGQFRILYIEQENTSAKISARLTEQGLKSKDRGLCV